MLSFTPVQPQFGGKLQPERYYTNVADIIKTLRPVASLRIIARHLAAANLKTPSGLEFNRDRLANFIRSSAMKSDNK